MAAELATTLVATEARRLEQAEGLVRGFCGWHIAPSRAAVAVTLDGTGSSILPLPSLYVTAVTAVVEDGVTLNLDSIEWSKDGWLEKCYGRWTRKPSGVVVTIDARPCGGPAGGRGGRAGRCAARRRQPWLDQIRLQDGPFSETFTQTGFNQSTPLALLDSEKEALGPYRILPI